MTVNSDAIQKRREEVLAQILREPEKHGQGTFETNFDYPCNTVRCVAGWAVHFENPTKPVEETALDLGFTQPKCPCGCRGDVETNREGNIEKAAAHLLGLTTEQEIDSLFYELDDHSAITKLQTLVSTGQVPDWDAML